ncbi:MAG: thiamine-phosphate kinase [Candidatus Thermoplasmatota archaeon]|nr:thiamine-phosphate kinase [Candidatus Thermoplasmatota archaeon]
MKTLGTLGERGAIRIIDRIVKSDAEVGIGDDCAAIDMGDRFLLVTTDMMAPKTHFPKGMGPYDIGWSIVAVNLSDIAAMGGHPLAVVTAIGMTRGHPIEYLEQIVDGMNDCARHFGTSIVGGDTKEHEILTLCGTAVGEVARDSILLRKGARPGDLVAISGELGRAGAGYYSLKRNLSLEEAETALKRPRPRLKEAAALADTGFVTSCMDISDGLSSSIFELARSSGLTYEIDYSRISKAKEVELAFHDLERQKSLVLNFGNDYELLFTIKREAEADLANLASEIGCPLTVIGKVTSGEENILIDSGKREKLENLGYEHFRTRQS